jgi:hypothetical protein
MARRMGALLCAATVIASVVLVLPAHAQPEVPEKPNIEDPAGDANYLNSQGTGEPGEDQTTPQDLTVSDILAVWFTHDAKTISMHFQTEGPPPSSNASYLYRVYANPGDNESGCIRFDVFTEGPTFVGGPVGVLRDECAEDFEPVEGEVVVEEGPEETGITTLTLERSSHEALADGAVITSPWAEVRNATGPVPGVGTLIFPIVDDTKIGSDYTITKPCPKGKGKKKKKCPGAKSGGGPAPTSLRDEFRLV